MQESPHLLPLVRSLRASFAEGMLTTLTTVNFPNLREILLEQDTHGSEPDQASISAAAKLISISSVRHVALWSLNFRDLDDFARLFTLCMPQLDSISLNDVGITSRPVKEPSTYLMHRVLVKTLTVQARYDMKWLLDARSPLDFSALSEFDGSMMLKAETIAGIFERAGASLVHLKLGTVFDPQDLVDAFTHIPCLSQLTRRHQQYGMGRHR
ncbi:hypothetical protein C8R43DRAFT_1137920 [Mycena crocata]|nr:hypothetical protein C8R43DRAFT_1137920 [Mycena crocata]